MRVRTTFEEVVDIGCIERRLRGHFCIRHVMSGGTQLSSSMTPFSGPVFYSFFISRLTHLCAQVHRLRISRRQHKDVLSLALTKRHHVPIHHFHKPTCLNGLPIELSPIRALQINKVWLDLARLVTKCVRASNVPELDDRMLLRDARVL